jgi:hypothetical protein
MKQGPLGLAPHDVEIKGDLQLRSPADKRLVTEAVTAGLAFATLLCWLSACLVSAFGCKGYDPYWSGIPWLRTGHNGFRRVYRRCDLRGHQRIPSGCGGVASRKKTGSPWQRQSGGSDVELRTHEPVH